MTTKNLRFSGGFSFEVYTLPMNSNRYDKFQEEDIILRDQLAIDRTELANDRTILSFGRTALTLVLAGGTILHFLDGQKWQTLGWFFGFLGLLVFGIGIVRYRRIHNQLRNVEKSMDRLIIENE